MINQRNYQIGKIIKDRIDLYLQELTVLFANLGTDSTKAEVSEAYKREAEYIELIAELDSDKGDRLRSSY